MMFLKVVLFVTGLCFVSTASVECPTQEDIYPCICRQGSVSLVITCNSLTIIDELQRVTSALKEYSISHFIITKSILTYIPANSFAGPKIKFLDISDSELSNIGMLGEAQFSGQEDSLEILKMTNSFTEKRPLAYLSLGHLQKLSDLNLDKNFLGSISNHWFKGGPVNLKTLSFQESNIRVIGPRAFIDLENIVNLNLCRNDLNFLSPYMFPNPARHLTSLDFSFNKISSLPEDLFQGMPQLNSVNFELNEFTTISENLWSTVWSQLRYLNLEYNPLECDSKIKWIYEKGGPLENKIFGSCYKPFRIMDRTLDSLKVEELG